MHKALLALPEAYEIAKHLFNASCKKFATVKSRTIKELGKELKAFVVLDRINEVLLLGEVGLGAEELADISSMVAPSLANKIAPVPG